MTTAHELTAIARAELFLSLAEKCTPEQRTEFEAFLEAAIVFSRAALHRLKSEFESHPSWKVWFTQLNGNPSVKFFREHRNFLLKEASPKVGQSIFFNPVSIAAQLYYFEDPSITATATVRNHLQSYAKTLQEGEACFRK
ncbi:MAG: hypothetical protein ACSLFB_05720 [Acidimicrobiales bacterium]